MATAASTFDLPDPLSGGGPAWQKWANELDPIGNRYQQSQSSWPTQAYTYGQPARGGVEYDPLPTGESFDPLATQLGHASISANVDDWLKQTYPQFFSFSDANMQTNAGQISSPGGNWAPVDRYNQSILGAVQTVQKETGVYVPPNVVKSIMKIESNGNMNEGPAYGLMQLTLNTFSNFTQQQLDRMRTDANYGIYAGVKELAARYKNALSIDPNYNWGNVAVGYFSGHYVPNGSSDGYNTDYNYLKMFNDHWNELSGYGAGGTQAAAGTKQITAIWGGFDAPVSQEFGMTDFAQQVLASGSTMYDYTSQYTRDGKPMGHAGVDIGIKYNTPLFAPVAGVVKLAGGTGSYCDKDGNGCGPNVGEFMVEMPNGDQLILGHMSQIGTMVNGQWKNLHIGDKITPGEFVGYSGSENGAHVHVEYRRWVGEGVTDEGHEVVDPRLALQGIFTGSYGAAGSGAVLAAGADNWQQFMQNAAQGLPISGAATVGGFHDWLRGQMGLTGTPLASGSDNTSYEFGGSGTPFDSGWLQHGDTRQ